MLISEDYGWNERGRGRKKRITFNYSALNLFLCSFEEFRSIFAFGQREREREFLPRGFLSTRNVDVIEGRRGKLMALTVWEARKGIYRSFECTSRAETSSIFQQRGGGGEKKGKKKGTESNKETRSLETEKERDRQRSSGV